MTETLLGAWSKTTGVGKTNKMEHKRSKCEPIGLNQGEGIIGGDLSDIWRSARPHGPMIDQPGTTSLSKSELFEWITISLS